MNPYMWHPLLLLADTPYIGVLGAIIVGTVIGMVWYSQSVFGVAWMQQAGLTKKDIEGKKGLRARIWNLPIMILLAMHVGTTYQFIGGDTLMTGIFTGAISARVVILIMVMHYLYEQKSLKLFLINAGYVLVTLVAMGATVALLA